MTMPFYVAPEQVMKDRAEYAQKGIARGRSLIATIYDAGILIATENSSTTLHKISEIYDRIAFAGVGKFNEFDQLRVAGVRHADVRGYTYSRDDVDGRSLANLYAQYLGQVFTHEMKPLEVEILVAELGVEGMPSELYHVAYDGTVADEDRFIVIGGEAVSIGERFERAFRADWALGAALYAAAAAIAGPDRTLAAGDLEVAVLARANGRRAFRRVPQDEVGELLAAGEAEAGAGAEGAGGTAAGATAETGVPEPQDPGPAAPEASANDTDSEGNGGTEPVAPEPATGGGGPGAPESSESAEG